MKRPWRQRVLSVALTIAVSIATLSNARAEGEEGAKPYGKYTPNAGFRLADTENGTLNFRIYAYIRYLNQLGLDETYTDAFGDTTTLDRRNDILFQKVNIQFDGWLMSQKFRYFAYVWTSNTSQGLGAQVVVGGNLNYVFNPYLTVGGGIDALPGVRATEGNFPFWLTVDNRLIADEFFRPSYTMGIWARGKVVDRVSYRFMLGNNLSQLGVDAGQLDNKLNSIATALIWYPTTGEYGTRGGFGDFDSHEQVATRLGVHFTSSTETRQGQPDTEAFENVQIRLSDGSVIFAPGLFGAGIQVEEANYRMFSADAGAKYRGFSLEGEYYWRWVNGFRTRGTGNLSFDELTDTGFQLQGSAMVLPSTLQLYLTGSKVYGDYGDPWETRLGANWFPWKNSVVRWNFEYLHTDRSPVGALSLPYLVGGTGDIFCSSFQINF
jgi:hypothetical protein